ncbi:CotH kinase family protein [Chryseobacterium sediminis]|uniref:Leucine-rich repeat protein n=1 Tax=Chryseobacterium sediminis TaxID=1679494 RepID=A0A5B2UDG1_9FLAO|nr:CotH kinase family protein [Chryseobacterium sediminis]KAA2224503.1 leucine-rich repeat protein [Chryseobacterium sediminis]
MRYTGKIYFTNYERSDKEVADNFIYPVMFFIKNEDGKIIKQIAYSALGEKSESEYGTGGGTGGGNGIVFRAKSEIPASFVKSFGSEVRIVFSWSSIDSVDGSETGGGTASILKGNTILFNKNINQGANDIDITPYILAGDNTITLSITDSYGNNRKLKYDIQTIALALSTTYDKTTINSGPIIFRYIPTGNVEKTIHFKLNGSDLPPVITSINNKELLYEIPAQSHGVHILEVYMTADLSGEIIESNHLFTDIISVVAGNLTPLVSSANNVVANQYAPASIEYLVYSPSSNYSDVEILVDGVKVSELLVNRSLQKFIYTFTDSGAHTVTFKCGNVTKNTSVVVTAFDIQVEAETLGLELFLSSRNRSNSEINKNEWKYKNLSCTLTDFDFSTNGWIQDSKGSVALKVSGNARVEIPFKIFDHDFKTGGKTLEFEFSTSDIKNSDSTIFSCKNGNVGFVATSNSFSFSSEQDGTSIFFKEEERIRVSIVVTKVSDQRLVFVYINGIISSLYQYNSLDSFLQQAPQNITIGSSDCNINLYNIRVYNNNLNADQMLSNFIADMDNLVEKVNIYERNKLYDAFGNLSYDKCLQSIPCLTIVGDLPTYKGDKKTIVGEYENAQDPTKSFSYVNASIDVQGTSSQYYPRKNFKIKFNGGFKNGELVSSKYKLRDNSLAEKTFTFKADFMESSGSHNIGLARLAQDSLNQLGYLVPPQLIDPNIRTTMDGFPMLIFHRATPDSERIFLGKYNFNNDKSNEATTGFTGGQECWEFLNNTSDNTLFIATDFQSADENGKHLWKNDFEGRYPENNEDTSNLEALHRWIVSCKNNPAKFKTEAPDHFNIQFLLFYYVFTEFFAMVDQRAKNQMFAMYPDAQENNRWYLIFYDNDTVLGLNNEGHNVYDYWVEAHDQVGSGFVWNGALSELWKLVEVAFDTEITALYQQMRTSGILTYDKCNTYFNTLESDKWAESIFNEDAKYKYIDPLVVAGNGSYLYTAQGSRKSHRNYWLLNRFRYMDGKYDTSTFSSDYITMRLYTPSGTPVVPPNANFLLTALKDGYTKIKFGSYINRARLRKNVASLVQAPAITFNDTETIIYGASAIKDLGDLSGKYLGTLDVSKATNLSRLQIGSQISGYSNQNLRNLFIGNNTILEELDVTNCPNLKQSIDLTACTSIKRVSAAGTGISSVLLPKGGLLASLILPSTASTLILDNQKFITYSNLTFTASSIKTLVIKDCPLINVSDIVSNLKNLSRVRINNLNGSSASSEMFFPIINAKGIDDSGNTTPHSVVEGTWNFTTIYQEDKDFMEANWPDFKFTFSNVATFIQISSATRKATLLNVFNTNGDGELSFAEARAVINIPADTFNTDVNTSRKLSYSFDEFRFFTNVETIGDRAFNSYENQLESIIFPPNIKKIGSNAFYFKYNAVVVGNFDKLEELGEIPFYGRYFDINLFKNVKIYTTNSFQFMYPRAGKYTLPYITRIFKNMLTNNVNNYPVEELVSNLVDLSGCTSLERMDSYGLTLRPLKGENEVTIILPASINYIENYCMPMYPAAGQFGVTRVIIKVLATTPPILVGTNFVADGIIINTVEIHVPASSISAYKTATNWSYFAAKIYPIT